MKILNLAEIYLQHAAETIVENKALSAFAIILASTIQMVMESIQIDLFLLLGLFLMIALNTFTGVRLARINGTYNLKELKTSVMGKLIGYLILLTGLFVFCVLLYVASLKDDTKLFSEYWFNLPTVLCLVFLAAVEFKSMLDNLKDLGIVVPGFVSKIPDSVQDKINDLGNPDNAKL